MRRSPLLHSALTVTLLSTPIAIIANDACAQTAASPLLLQVFINDNDTGKVASFQIKGSRIFATAAELRSLGLAPPAGLPSESIVDLTTLVDRPPVLDEKMQTIALAVPISALAPHRVIAGSTRNTGPLIVPFGALINYDVAVTRHDSKFAPSGYISTRFFGRLGALKSDMLLNLSSSNLHVKRLNTTYSYSDVNRIRTYAAGDIISGTLPYSRSLRLGGIQISSNFGLRPDLITYPVPALNGGAAVPSTIDVFVNGIRQLSEPVDAGPFTISQLPLITGAGQLSIAVRNEAGQQKVQTSSFYVNASLLKPGLSAFSLEAGAIRRRFGMDGASYGPFAFSVTNRRGLTPSLTLEGHAEGAEKLGLLAGGATLLVRNFATMTVAVSGSKSSTGSGFQSYFALERTTSSYHFGISAISSSRHFHDLAGLAGDLPPRYLVQANAGLILGRQGSLGIAYTDIARPRSTAIAISRDPITVSAGRTSLLSGTYSREVFGRAYFYLTAYSELNRNNRAISAGLSFRLGGQGTLSASFESTSHQATIEAGRPALNPGDIGWHVFAGRGASDRFLGEITHQTDQGEIGVGIDRSRQSTATKLNARGSLVIMGGSMLAAPLIHDGFALVETPGFANVGVTVNNRLVGRTGKGGKLLARGLSSYQSNSISIDPNDLPPDAQWDQIESSVAPQALSGVVTRFSVKRNHEARVTVIMENGRLLPVGSQIYLDGFDMATTSGFDGQAFFPELRGRHSFSATLPEGGRCKGKIDVLNDNSWPVIIKTICI